MAWIESHESLPTHPKTKRLCRLLKITPVVAVGHLHFLWWWAMNHAQDGDLDRYTPDDVADACSWDGDPESFFSALVESEFIDRTRNGFAIHDWFVYAGKLIALRQKDAKRKKDSRGKRDESNGHPTDIQRTSKGSLPESIRDLDLNPNLDLNQEKKDATTAPPNPFSLYQSEGFGMLTEITGQKIGDMVDDFGEPWVCEAMKEASYYGKRNLPYVKSILNRYRTSGIDEPWKQEKAGGNNGGSQEGVRQGGSTFADKPVTGGKSGILPSKYFKVDENGELQVSGL